MNAIDRAFIRAYESDDRLDRDESPAESPAAARSMGGKESPGIAAQAVAIAKTPAVPPTSLAAAVESNPVNPASTAASDRPGGSSGERRPLSTFAAKPTIEARFKPALEVDRFRWSAACEQLISTRRELLRPVLHTLMAADEAGRSLIGIGGPAAGVGCTTVLTCVARLLVDAGKSVAIVDGNFRSPGLAFQLGLAVETGWEQVLDGSLPLAEAVVWSIDDRMALLPLARGGSTAAASLQSIHASVTAGVLRYHYDMVLVDLGTIADPQQAGVARRLVQQCRLDGALIVSGAAPALAVHPQRLMQTAPELASICLGVVENQLRAA